MIVPAPAPEAPYTPFQINYVPEPTEEPVPDGPLALLVAQHTVAHFLGRVLKMDDREATGPVIPGELASRSPSQTQGQGDAVSSILSVDCHYPVGMMFVRQQPELGLVDHGLLARATVPRAGTVAGFCCRAIIGGALREIDMWDSRYPPTITSGPTPITLTEFIKDVTLYGKENQKGRPQTAADFLRRAVDWSNFTLERITGGTVPKAWLDLGVHQLPADEYVRPRE